MIRQILLGLSAAFAGGILFVNLYSSFVDAPNWGADIPNSISTARQYYAVANPGTFFRVVSPLNQLLALVVVILSWKKNRYIALASLAVAVLADVLTFGYFYPRNEIMFIAPLNADTAQLAWEQWSSMNWFRSALCFVNVVLAFVLIFNSRKSAV